MRLLVEIGGCSDGGPQQRTRSEKWTKKVTSLGIRISECKVVLFREWRHLRVWADRRWGEFVSSWVQDEACARAEAAVDGDSVYGVSGVHHSVVRVRALLPAAPRSAPRRHRQIWRRYVESCFLSVCALTRLRLCAYCRIGDDLADNHL